MRAPVLPPPQEPKKKRKRRKSLLLNFLGWSFGALVLLFFAGTAAVASRLFFTSTEVVGEGFVLIGARRHFYTGEVMQILRHRDLQPQPLPPAK